MTNRRRTLVAAQLGLAAAFLILAGLLVSGAGSGVDQHAVNDWMVRVGTGRSSLWGAFRPWPDGGSASEIAFNIWTFPASVLVSGAVLLVCCIVLDRRGQRRAAGAWIVAWLVVNAVEVIGKGLLHRPTLSTVKNGAQVPVVGFDSSFPSGHTARRLLLACMLAAVWPRLSWPVAIWAAGTCLFLVLNGDHTPTDILGGVLLTLFVLTWVPWRPEFLRQE